MKNKHTFICLLLSVLCLGGCINNTTPSEDDGPRRVIDSFIVDNRSIEFKLGDTYKTGKKTDYTFVYKFSDNTKEEFPIERVLGVENIINKDTDYAYSDTTFISAGKHAVNLKVKSESETIVGPVYYDIESGIDAGYNLKSIKTLNDLAYTKGNTFNELNPNIQIEVMWNTGSNDVKELFSSNSEYLSTSLTSGGTTKDVSNQVLEGGKTYTFTASLSKKPNDIYTQNFTVSNNLGYYNMAKSSLVHEDYEIVAPHEGDTNLLVVLLDIPTGNTETDQKYSTIDWTSDNIKKANDYFFGKREDTPNDWNSLKTYYEQVSLNKININGLVADVYTPDPNKHTIKSILENTNPYAALHRLFAEAIEHIETTRTDINWSDFDRNDDGYLDNLHFITNATSATTRLGDYGRALWPHKYGFIIPQTPDLDKPVGNVYETTALGHFSDPNTIIHEQGHVFGLADYYDYGYTGADYVGCYDMQSHNLFDWNSFSKFSVGWANPIVIDGTADSATLKLQSSALTNQCLVIPADHSTYNGSAFDEYFLLELYTADGNNEFHWNKYYGKSITQAIKLYHVDARICRIRNGYEPTLDEIKSSNKNTFAVGTNNSYDYRNYEGYSGWGDYKLLALIQQGGKDTFGETDGNGEYDFLGMGDLFHSGQTFEFDKYKHFLSKTGKTVTTMDNGETFPYRITIQNIANKEAIITVTKIK